MSLLPHTLLKRKHHDKMSNSDEVNQEPIVVTSSNKVEVDDKIVNSKIMKVITHNGSVTLKEPVRAHFSLRGRLLFEGMTWWPAILI